MGLANHEERKKVEEKEEIDLSDLLYDFGDNLKSQTTNNARLSIMPNQNKSFSFTQKRLTSQKSFQF